eukprot:jgi/Galph1/4411/GphlegSOOS_G3080.1
MQIFGFISVSGVFKDKCLQRKLPNSSRRPLRFPSRHLCRCSSLYLYNSKSKQKEIFKSLNPHTVLFYSCGPTVYDFAHVGNFRAFLSYDLLKRWLSFIGYKVIHVLNITDIDDKIIQRAMKEDKSLEEITNFYTEKFFEDLRILNCLPADYYPRATQHIPSMCELIDKLLQKQYAYVSKSGCVFFSVDRYPSYGVFSTAQDRVDEEELSNHEKLNPRDFVLWKRQKAQDGHIGWPSPYGKGRPGWHLECSCMALKYLGEEIDIHAGGTDLIFPHHENEIAQVQAVTGKTFVRYWFHNGFVEIDNQKMSKSLNNWKKLRDIAQSALDIRAFRYLVITSHYRAPLSFHQDALKGARNTIRRLDNFMNKLQHATQDNTIIPSLKGIDEDSHQLVQHTLQQFQHWMNDDLNTPRAIAVLFEWIKQVEEYLKNRNITHVSLQNFIQLMQQMNSILGIFYQPSEVMENIQTESIPEEVWELVKQREAARKQKSFSLSDELRNKIGSYGFQVLDTPQGSQLKRL